MTAPGNSVVLFILLAAFLACTGYAAGRLHQWYRTGQDRDEAYRDGYDTATRSVFSMAARIIGPRRADRPAARGSAAVHSSESCSPDVSSRGASEDARVLRAPTRAGRHTVPDELVQAPTYRLSPDRVARAKVRSHVPGNEPSPASGGESRQAPAAESPPPPVPKPRSS
jgi:hypothetical protein